MAWNFGDKVQFGGGECHGARYITHLEAGFYSNVVECLPVDPATRVGFLAVTGWNIFRSTPQSSEKDLRGGIITFITR